MAELITLLIVLLIAGGLIWFGCWAVDKSRAPDPFNWILKLIIVLVIAFGALTRLGYHIPS